MAFDSRASEFRLIRTTAGSATGVAGARVVLVALSLELLLSRRLRGVLVETGVLELEVSGLVLLDRGLGLRLGLLLLAVRLVRLGRILGLGLLLLLPGP